MTTVKNTFRKEKPEKAAKKKKPKKEKTIAKPTVESKKDEEVKRINFKFSSLVSEQAVRIYGLFFIIMAAYLLLAMIAYLFTWKEDFDIVSNGLWESLIAEKEASNWLGKLGAYTSHLFIYKWFGIASFLFIFLSFITGIKLMTKISLSPVRKSYQHSFFHFIWISAFMGFLFSQPDKLFMGGAFGYHINIWLDNIFGKIGNGFLLAFIYLSYLIITFNLSFRWLRDKLNNENLDEELKTEKERAANSLRNINATVSAANMSEINEDDIDEDEEGSDEDLEGIELVIDVDEFSHEKKEADGDIQFTVSVGEETQNIEEEEEETPLPEPEKSDYDPRLDLSGFQFPTLDLLDDHGSETITVQQDELEMNKNRIIETLGNYGIGITKIKATIGPTVTLYEIVPDAGVRIAKIKNLEDDIALSLSALGIRIIAPIPGKGTIGIEVPNQNPEIVSMKAILGSDKYLNTKFDLPIGLGKTISNETFIADLAKMPHLLMAGATGQGKSVGINAILASLLYKKHPAELKFVLVDPKKVELSLFNKIERHYLAKLPGEEEPIICDTSKVVKTLNSLCIEMDARYDLLKAAGVRNIKEYNAKFIKRKLNPNEGHRFLPYIVLIIDEFADLIITAGREVETPIARLAQLARAIGIHLIIATQRPSVNIITGSIKANFPARLAFRVISKIDSRTILDGGGADQLIGRGDMLLATGSDMIRIQCAFVDTPEIERITTFIGEQHGYPNALLLPEVLGEEADSSGDLDASQRDPMFEEAARLLVQYQQGSTSLIQRKLKLGYNRAGRIVDQLEAAGIVGPFEGSKARDVKIKDMNSLEQLLSSMQ